MTKPEDRLAAGGYLSVQEKLKNESTVDRISARVYQHPALGNRRVVRLTADNLAAGEDLTLDFLGFGPPAVEGPVAKRQRQALGFPGWALVNDPKHARFALALVKGFKKAVRRSKAKPGHGYDEFVETSKQLGSSVAHFLPSFWEQVGREFIAVDNATYASRAFGKAREAEKVHALKVDESTRQDAFLEFALAGAVSIKALTEYGKELLSTHDPKSAWTFFRELCVRRVLGGMPPWPAMFKDMQPLMKGAGLDVDRETESILTEITDCPAISRAPMGFWENVSKSIGQLVKKDTRVAGALLNMIPKSSGWREENIWGWLDHLEAWGILSNAWKKGIAAEAGPDGGAAAWLKRLFPTFGRPRQRIYDLLESMVPRLREDKVPVDLYLNPSWRSRGSGDVDLLDLALELKVPLVDPPQDISFDLDDWAVPIDADKGARNRPRDPVHLAADSRFAPVLRKAVSEAAGNADFEIAATGKEALKQARREWLAGLVDGVSNGGLPRAESSLDTIDEKAQRAIFKEFPDELERLQSADMLAAVTRTIQGGLLDEYGWPELERVFESFVAAGCRSPEVFGAFPYLIVTDKLKAVVLKGNRVVHEAELRLPKKHKLEFLLYVDGDLLVWAEHDYRTECCWNSDRKTAETGYFYVSGQVGGVVIDVSEGGTFVGEKIIHRGDKDVLKLRATDSVFSDGKHWWSQSRDFDEAADEFIEKIHEIDPVTGKRGRQSLPAFFEDYVKDGTQLDIDGCQLLPLGAEFPKSALGSRDGLLGSRTRTGTSGSYRIEGIDGRALEIAHLAKFTGLLNQPGTDGYLPVGPIATYRGDDGFRLWDPTGEMELSEIKTSGGYSDGQAAALPAVYLHAFQLRDVAASKKLRAVNNKQVQALLDAEQQDWESFQSQKSKPSPAKGASKAAKGAGTRDAATQCPKLDAAIRKLLGTSIHPRLLTGLRGVVIQAGETLRQRARIAAQRAGESVVGQASDESKAADVAAKPYLESLSYSFDLLPNLSFMETVSNLTSFLAGQAPSVPLPEKWFDTVKSLSEGVPQPLWSEYCQKPEDKKWISFAEAWCEVPFLNLPGWFRRFDAEPADEDFMDDDHAEHAAQHAEYALTGDDFDDDEDEQWAWALPYIGKSSRFLIRKSYGSFEVLEYSATGKFESIPGLTEESNSVSISSPSVWSTEALRTFVRQAKANPVNIPPADVLNAVASEVQATAAEVALIWLGLPNFDHYGANFMPTPLREACQLKTKECSAARESLRSMPPRALRALTDAVISGDPAELWESPPTKVADRLIAAWRGGQLDRIPLSPEWVKKLTDALSYGVDNGQWLEAINCPDGSPLFSPKGNWSFQKKSNNLVLACDTNGCSIDEHIPQAAAVTIALLAYGLPVGDPARKKVIDVHRATIKALANPGLMIQVGTRYEFDAKKVAACTRLVESTVGKMKPHKTILLADDGVLSVAYDSDEFQIAVRPSKVTTPKQWERLSNQLQALLQNSDDEDGEDDMMEALDHVRLLRSPEFAALIKRIEKSPVPNEKYETNPILSAPDVVQQIVKKQQLTDNAAAYYLQLLALPDPTDKNITLWNDWTPAELKKVAAELIKKKLVLEATRARAGRKYFLPGGWEDLKSPHLPIETWKLPLFEIVRDEHGRATPPLGRILPLETVHSLFTNSWQRIIDGDVPKYQAVK